MSDPLALGLPHREPFVFVDEILAHSPGESAAGHKTFPADTPFFRGHFPGDPLVPGVILAEALAQVAGIAAGQAGMRLAAIKAMKFPSAARPGDDIACCTPGKRVRSAGSGNLQSRRESASA